jgi:hypothetical protein
MFTFRKASNRNTEAYRVRIGQHNLYISYSTVIGYSGPLGTCRRHNDWGPTTGKHINEMGIRDWVEVDEETMHQRVRAALLDTGLRIWGEELGVKDVDKMVEEATT